ncbi:hypothetical protein LTR70_004719 [Exophiala xenobiotica]|uniref:Uncharacterized protein n=1 Tax=Lithohypha guttulata TaxID=1690604 RepID=A0ABR0KC66_9EURO|nr:hypothetical protein LTR24_004335 [Lithohypha guttulata]KAK5319933.1 hypothetical protein LTR70_004719 [Exophiala xenobiotica]
MALREAISHLQSLKLRSGVSTPLSDDTMLENKLQVSQVTIQQYEVQIRALENKANNASNLIGNMLELDNGNALKNLAQASKDENVIMLRLTQKSTSDAAAVKILTVTTLIYLPATVVLVRCGARINGHR